MAKNKILASKSKTKKKAKPAGATVKIKIKKGKSSKTQTGFDAIARLAEHPIVSDLIAIGATVDPGPLTIEVERDTGRARLTLLRFA